MAFKRIQIDVETVKEDKLKEKAIELGFVYRNNETKVNLKKFVEYIVDEYLQVQ